MTKKGKLAFAAFVTVVVLTNIITNAFGVVNVWFITATAGTFIAGFAFVARDSLQENAKKRWVLVAIAAGALISAVFSPALALASGVAFLLSELLDWAAYTPLRERGKTRAALASNAVGSVADTVVFLYLAREVLGLTGLPTAVLVSIAVTQVLVKFASTSAFVGTLAGVSYGRRRRCATSRTPAALTS